MTFKIKFVISTLHCLMNDFQLITKYESKPILIDTRRENINIPEACFIT